MRKGWTHDSAKRMHAALHGGVALSLILGLVAVFANHGGHGIPPLYSAHSWMGVATAGLVACQAGAGAAVYLWGETFGVTPGTRAALMPWHRFFGAATFGLGVATCCMGFVEKQAGAIYPCIQSISNIYDVYGFIVSE